MKVTCPKCEFSGNIRDELIPTEGKNVNCPKCKTKIFVKKENALEAPVKTTLPPLKKPPTKQINAYIAIAGFVICIGLGVLIGTQINKSEKPVIAETHTPPQENIRKPVEIEEATPPTPTPVPDESEFVSTEYIDDFKIEAVIAETEGMTSVQEEEHLYRNGFHFIKKMIRGDFIVDNAFEMNSYYETAFPAGMYSYIISASSSEFSVYSNEFQIYVGTNNQDLIRNIAKDSRIYIEGYIYSFSHGFGTYDFFVVNAKIEFL
jgi:predicted Zn finger-like uncharacterized protein